MKGTNIHSDIARNYPDVDSGHTPADQTHDKKAEVAQSYHV